MEAKTRKKLEALLWKNTHKDYRGTLGKERTVLHDGGGKGTCLIAISDLTDLQLLDKLSLKKCTLRLEDIRVTNFKFIRHFKVEDVHFYDVYDVIGPKVTGPFLTLEEAQAV